MVVCGIILERSNYQEIFLSCSQCVNLKVEMRIEQWQEFIGHLKSAHSDKNVLDDIDMVQGEIKVENQRVEVEAQSEVDCLAEVDLVDLPNSDNDSTSGESNDDDFQDEDVEDCEGMTTRESNRSGRTATSDLPPTFNPTFYRRNPRITQFIELYQGHPCLWDPKDPCYANKEKRSDAYAAIIEQLKISVNVQLTPYKLKKCILTLHSQYASITRQKKTQKLSKVPLYYHEKYRFLAKKNEAGKGQGEEVAIHSSDEESRDDKIKLIFTETNSLTTRFIELYSRFAELYDPTQKNFALLEHRKMAYTKMTKILTAEFNLIDLTHYDVYDSIQALRQWYSRRIKGLTELQSVGLVDAEKHYIDKCSSFLTTKTFRLQLPCSECQQYFSNDHSLQAHQYRVHKLGKGGWFWCPQCRMNFERRCHLRQHNQRVHMGKSFSCSQCQRSFAFANQLNLHQRTHDEQHVEKPFVCEFCGKSFKQKIQMNNHVTAVHTKIRAFKCQMCPKDFLTKRDLSDHVKAHLNIRDKVCEICQKAFCSANALVKHRHIHREKTLECSLCPTRFADRVSLHVHLKRTHKIIKSTLKVKAEKTETVPQQKDQNK
ncbi:zinc finger protein 655 isoform X2 [Drosophila willistoni]|uniref:zinc finger protein 655 isoform X2 n=1 Tax=Drosophila willistoni TaxID=7260 RepID=UPI001F072386|nr:zinc finger protein 655 isoform X2 [Drosophila willistoni]